MWKISVLSVGAAIAFLCVGHANDASNYTECVSEDTSMKPDTYACIGGDLAPPGFFQNGGGVSVDETISRIQIDKVKADIKKIDDQEGSTDPTGALISSWRWNAAETAAKFINGKLSIPVCWVNPIDSDLDNAGRTLTETAIKDTWNVAETGVIFSGWKPCADTGGSRQRGIRILIIDRDGVECPKNYLGNSSCRPRAIMGKFANDTQVSMWLNFSFSNFALPCSKKIGIIDNIPGEYNWSNCVWSIAVHEFGHSLGLVHEQDRLFYKEEFNGLSDDEKKKFLDECNQRISRDSSGKPISTFILSDFDPESIEQTVFDPHSVMNYCFEIYTHRAKLTKYDKKVTEASYGDQQ